MDVERDGPSSDEDIEICTDCLREVCELVRYLAAEHEERSLIA
jgi:hypothetical protein